MFNKISATGSGLVVLIPPVIILIGKFFGIEIAETDAAQLVQFVMGAIGLLLTYWGQWKRKDLVAGIIRR